MEHEKIVCKTVKMPYYRLELLKHIAYMMGIPTMHMINNVLQKFIEENESLIQSYNDLFDK